MTHELPARELSVGDAYHVMTGLVAPRPIAWVSTVDGEGRPNLAPFSYFQAVCSSPPTIVLGIAWLPSGRPKDTLANILATGELTISHVSEDLTERMNASSAAFAHGVSEWERCGVDSTPAVAVAPRRVAAARGGFECRLTHAIPLGIGKRA
jgi:flavin reductase (DIM6/NTAB) family NADH-FMN oxidoreductase RutF